MKPSPHPSPDTPNISPSLGSDSATPLGAAGLVGAPLNLDPVRRGRDFAPPRHSWPAVRSRLDDFALTIALRLGVTPRIAVGSLLVALVLVLALVLRWASSVPAQAVPVPSRGSVPATSRTAAPAETAPKPPAPPSGQPSALAVGAPGAGASASAAVPSAAGSLTGAAGPGLTVHVAGQVRRPGVIDLPPGARVKDAIALAGGFTAAADQNAINLARPVLDGEQILVTKPGEPAGMPPPAAAGSASGASSPASPIDLNLATMTQLELLPGVGPVLAERIFQWRTEHGRFSSVDELGEVSGIGPTILERIRPLARV